MLGILSVVLLVLGVFVAGGGAFDWQFLFSDGHREHEWVRSLSRGGARGLLMLVGGVLVIVGFVGQVVENAAKPIVVTVNTERTFDLPGDPASPTRGSASPSTETGNAGRPTPGKGPVSTPPHVGPSPQTSQSPAAAENRPPAAGANQPITIWNPQLDFAEAEVMIMLQYRFEPGHELLPGAEYFWLIEVPAKPTEVVYDTLQSEGRLEYILRLPQPEKRFRESWSTVLMVERNGKRTQVSNRLEIIGGQVRSTALGAR